MHQIKLGYSYQIFIVLLYIVFCRLNNMFVSKSKNSAMNAVNDYKTFLLAQEVKEKEIKELPEGDLRRLELQRSLKNMEDRYMTNYLCQKFKAKNALWDQV